jgi:hypothetical protein
MSSKWSGLVDAVVSHQVPYQGQDVLSSGYQGLLGNNGSQEVIFFFIRKFPGNFKMEARGRKQKVCLLK